MGRKPPAKDMVWIHGGTFMMGSNDHYPEEAPASSYGGRFLDGPIHGHQRAVFPLRRRHGIPSGEFGAALEEIKKLAGNIPEAHIASQDVTEDFIDLEARISQTPTTAE